MSTKKTRRKSPVGKKKLSETGEYEVTTSDASIGSNTPKKKVQVSGARDAKDAVDKATNGDSRSADEVSVKKIDPRNPRRDKKMGVVGMESSTPIKSNKVICEGAVYPYKIALPVQFEKFLKEMRLEPKPIWDRVSVVVENKSQMTLLIRDLKKSDQPEAKIVLQGISESIQ